MKGLISVSNASRIVEYFKVAPTISLAELRTEKIVGRVYTPNLFKTYQVKVNGGLYKVGVKHSFDFDGYTASVMGLHCETEGYTHEECLDNIRKAIVLHIEVYDEMVNTAEFYLNYMQQKSAEAFATMKGELADE